jgi:uncharacterized protein
MSKLPHLFLSRFCSSWERNGTTAFMNTLRLRPVFVPTGTARLICRHFPKVESGVDAAGGAPLPADLSETLARELLREKILVDSQSYDDEVLARLRATVGQPEVRIAYFLLSDACNMKCSYCFIRKGMEPRYKQSNMTLDTALAAVEMFASLSRGVDSDERTIILYGGEPLLNPAVFHYTVDLVKQFKADGTLHPSTRLTLLTNGTLLTDEILRSIKVSKVSVSISIDGFALAHDASRQFHDGSSTYPVILNAIERCRSFGIPFSISPTITWNNIDHFDETLENIVSVIRPAGVGFNILMGGTDDRAESASYAERASAFIIEAFKVLREHGIPEDRMLRKIRAFTSGSPHTFDCAAAGGNQIVVAPDGQVGICHGFVGTREYFVSNVHDRSFNPASNPTFSEWNRRTPINMESCLACSGLGLCGGGCLHNASVTRGSIWEKDDRFCKHTLMTLEFLVWELHLASQARTVSRGAS